MLKIVFFVILALTAVGLAGVRNDEGPLFRSVYLTLANKTHRLPNNWETKIRLDTVENAFGEAVQIESETHAQFQLLREALLDRSTNVNIGIYSAYHSARSIQPCWDRNVKMYGEKFANEYLEKPGCSDHQTGLAVNICIINGKNIAIFGHEDKASLAKIHKLSPKYGFILRYPVGKEKITGHSYEPLHLRYVGSPRIAKRIARKGLTLEEYLGEY